jgi:ABC-type glycerol-3-phosphate transport system substrate-binding protein
MGLEAPKSWDDFFNACQAVRKNGQYGFSYCLRTNNTQFIGKMWNYRLAQAGGRIIDKDSQVVFNKDPGVIATEWWKKFYQAGLALPGSETEDPQTTTENLATGKMYEAARVDGASFWQSFRNITLPLLRPIVVAVSDIDIIGTVFQYDLVRLLTDGGPRQSTATIAYYLWKVAFMDGKLDYASTISMVLLIGLTAFIAVYLKVTGRGQTSDGTSF